MPTDENEPSTLTPGTLMQSPGEQARAAVALDPRAPAPGFAVPGYEILRRLGRGGMGAVHLALDLKLKREVALKTLYTTDTQPVIVARFWAEAEVMAAVKHPHVVQVYELGEYTGGPFIAMEYLAGGSLADRLKSGTAVTLGEAVALLEQIARGVAAAHELGIVHRDLKPGNVLLGVDGAPKVADFGLAKRLSNDMTQTQTLMGTPAYMAPEQAAGRAKFVGPQADVWALGVILYECVAGAKPFEGDTVETLLSQITSTEPMALRVRVRGLPRDIDTIVAKCLAKEPEQRYATAGELADDLARFRAGEPIAARPAGYVARTRRWCRRHPVATAVLIMSGVLVGAQMVATVMVARAYAAERAAKELAETRSREAEEARDAATAAAAEASDTAALLVHLVEMSDPLGSQPLSQEARTHRLDDETARELLASAVRHVRSRPAQKSVSGAALLDALGNACRSRGMFEDARALLTEAHETRRALLGGDSAEVAASLHSLGWLAQDEGRFAAAQELYRQALAMRRRILDADHPLVTATMFNLAWVTAHQFDSSTAERSRDAEALLRDILARQGKWPGAGHGDPVMTRLALALVLYTRDDPTRNAEVDALLKEIVALIPSYPKAKPFLEAAGKYLRSRRLWDEKKFAEAIELRVQVLGEVRALFGNDHMVVAYALGDLAGAYGACGRVEEGIKPFEEALRIGKKYFPGGHWLIARTLIEAGDKFAEVKRPVDADQRYREAMEMAAAVGRQDLWNRARDGRVKALRKLGRGPEADQLQALPVPKAP